MLSKGCCLPYYSRLDFIRCPTELFVGSVWMQSKQLGSVGGLGVRTRNLWSEQPLAPLAEDVIYWVGIPGRPPFVIPCKSAGWKKCGECFGTAKVKFHK